MTSQPRAQESPAPARTILLVDDEESIRYVMGRMLQSLGFSVIAAANGREALALFEACSESIDLALVDMSMPVMGGEAILRELRRQAPDLPLVLMSGDTTSEAANRLADVQLAGHVQKPFRLPVLQEMLHDVLRD